MADAAPVLLWMAAHRRAVHLLQPDLAGLHRAHARAGVGRRLGGGHPLRGFPALHGHLRRRVQRAPGVRDGIPPAPPRRRLPLDPRSRHAALHARRHLRGLHRLVRRHHRAQALEADLVKAVRGARRLPVDRVARAEDAADGAQARAERLQSLSARAVAAHCGPERAAQRDVGKLARDAEWPAPRWSPGEWSTSCSTCRASADGRLKLDRDELELGPLVARWPTA